MTMFSRFMNDESGATAIEYGLGSVRTELQGTLNKVSSELKGASN